MQKPKEPSYWLFKAVWKGWGWGGVGKERGGERLEEWRSVLDNIEVWMGRVSELGFLLVKVGGQKKKGGKGISFSGSWAICPALLLLASQLHSAYAGKSTLLPVNMMTKKKKITAAFVYKKRLFAFFLARFEVNCHLKEHHIPY